MKNNHDVNLLSERFENCSNGEEAKELIKLVVEHYRAENPEKQYIEAHRHIDAYFLLAVLLSFVLSMWYFEVNDLISFLKAALMAISISVYCFYAVLSTKVPEQRLWLGTDKLSDEDIIMLSNNKIIRKWLSDVLNEKKGLTHTFLLESLDQIEDNFEMELSDMESKRKLQLVELSAA